MLIDTFKPPGSKGIGNGRSFDVGFSGGMLIFFKFSLYCVTFIVHILFTSNKYTVMQNQTAVTVALKVNLYYSIIFIFYSIQERNVIHFIS